jgi:hypothetical protein
MWGEEGGDGKERKGKGVGEEGGGERRWIKTNEKGSFGLLETKYGRGRTEPNFLKD